MSLKTRDIHRALRAAAAQLDRAPTRDEYRQLAPRYDWPAISMIRRDYGTYTAALAAAGISPSPRRWPPDRIVTALCEETNRLGRVPRLAEWELADVHHPSRQTVLKVFGTWNAALAEAGLPPTKPRWSPERVIAAIRTWVAEAGEPPRYQEWAPACGRMRPEDRPCKWELEYPRWPSALTAAARFGTWRHAVEAAGFTPHGQKQRHTTQEQVIAGLRRFCKDNGRPPTRSDLFTSGDRRYPSLTLVNRRLGGLRRAYELLGWPSDRPSNRRSWSREQIVTVLREETNRLGHVPRKHDWERSTTNHPNQQIVRMVFGTWNAAVAAATLPPNRPGPPPGVVGSWSREQIITALREETNRRGHVPRGRGWKRVDRHHPSLDTVRRVFGTWNAALAAAGLPANKPGRRAGVHRPAA